MTARRGPHDTDEVVARLLAWIASAVDPDAAPDEHAPAAAPGAAAPAPSDDGPMPRARRSAALGMLAPAGENLAWLRSLGDGLDEHGRVTFGCYRGEPAGALLADASYCAWLLDSGVAGKYPAIGTLAERLHGEGILSAWRDADAAPGDRAAPPALAETARYPYHDAGGSLAYTVVRYAPKAFAIVASDGSPLPDPIPASLAVLYRLPQLLAAPLSETVHVAEGEKDAETLAGLGLTATSMPCGTRMGWLAGYTRYLAGRHVVVWPDADGPGRRHAAAVAAALDGTAATCVICDPHAGDRGPWDVTDWLARPGRGLPGLLAMAEAARLAAAGMAGASREDVIWAACMPPARKLVLAAAWHAAGREPGGRMPAGTVLAAATGLHRSTVTAALAGLRAAGHLAPGRELAPDFGLLALSAPRPAAAPAGGAAEWLAGQVAAGPRPAGQLRQAAAAAGVSRRALDTARASLGLASRRIGFGAGAAYVWARPGDPALGWYARGTAGRRRRTRARVARGGPLAPITFLPPPGGGRPG